MDFKAFVDRLIDLPWVSVLQVAAVMLVGSLAYQVYRRAAAAIGRAGKARRNWGALFENWQLLLLSSTAFVLSCASGWTTWDGMRNFTGEPILSAMVTFGIQGVMLIVAWLIGESFATGMSQQQSTDGASMRNDGTFRVALALVMSGVLIGGIALLAGYFSAGFDSTKVMNVLAGTGAALGIVGALIIAARAKSMRSYVDATRVMVRTAVLWVMFLACMATSVFFSFDSLFSTIFPKSERARATELRAQNQVAGLVADTGAFIMRRQSDEAEALFKDAAWLKYEGELAKIMQLAGQAPDAIRDEMNRELNAQNQRVQQLEEKRATAQSGQSGLTQRKTVLTEELARVSGERPDAATTLQQQKAVVGDVEKRFDEQRTKTLAEEKGVEGSGKIGRGQFYRASKGEEEKLQSELQVARERLKTHETRLSGIDRRITTIRAELAQIDGDLAKLKGEADTAGQMITVAKSTNKATDAERSDPIALAAALDRERQGFRQKPEQPTLAKIQNFCGALQGASMKAGKLRDAAAAIDCDPKAASEASSRVFALNAGIATFDANCNGGDKLAQHKSADALFEFARKCVQDSGLSSKDTDQLRLAINTAELNRDDKANRFVATVNAFQDGNKLAYLALAIAIAIDGLIFMSGLFGANAIRSPLSDVPTTSARSARQLEAIIENALLPDKFENAQLMLEALHPITPAGGYTGEVLIPLDHTATRGRILKVLNAGAAIGAVARDPNRPERYLVRPELFEFLSVVAKRAYEKDEDHARRNELEKIVTVSLLPDVGEAVETVMDHLHPIDEKNGFMARVDLHEIAEQHRKPVRNALNAGATLNVVQHAGKDFPGSYFIHGDMYKTLARIRGRMLMSSAPQSLQIGQQPLQRGTLQTAKPRIPGKGSGEQAQIGFHSESASPAPSKPAPGQQMRGETPVTVTARSVTADANVTASNPLLVNRKLMGEIRLRLLSKAGLTSNKHNALDEITDIGTATGAVTQAYLALCETDTHLGRMAWALLNQTKSGLDAEHARLTEQYSGDELYVDALEKEYSALLELLPAMLLTYKGLYDRMLQDEIDRLEDLQGKSELLPDGEPILDRLQLHSADLEKEYRMSGASWAAVARHVKAYTEPKGAAEAAQRKHVIN